MKDAYKLASITVHKEQSRAKQGYDKKMYGTDLQPGSRVLVRKCRERGGPGKLRSFWVDRIHVLTEQKYEGGPVYVVKPEYGPEEGRTLHRNLLLPCNFLPVEHDQQKESQAQPKKLGVTVEQKGENIKRSRENRENSV